MIIFFLRLVNFLTNTYDTIYSKIQRIYSSIAKAIAKAETCVWVFTHRNACPWLTTNIPRNILYFHPESNSFSAKTRSQITRTKKTMDDLVTAEIYDSNNILVADVSEFFQSISWEGAASRPSLYEIVLLSFLCNNTLLTQDELESYTLRVMTIDINTLDISLNSTKAKEDFVSWV